MARVIVSTLDSPLSEQRLVSALKEQLPARFVLLPALRFLRPASGPHPAHEGDADVLVLDPDRGFIVIEVKGGGIGRDDSGWHSIDQFGNRHEIKDPGKLAQNAAHAISDRLREHREFRLPKRSPAFGWGVCFPDISTDGSDLGAALPGTVIIDAGTIGYCADAIEAIFEMFHREPEPLTQAQSKAFLDVLAPELHLVPSLRSRVADEEARFVRLSDEQFSLLGFAAPNRKLVVTGGAGTGKTILAREKARRLAAEGKRTLFLCFNRTLALRVAAESEGYEALNFHEVCMSLAAQAGLPTEVPAEPERARGFWERTAPDLLMDALDALPDARWDAIVVDEGQDFRAHWWVAVMELLRDPAQGTLWVFHDPNQNIYSGELTGLDAFPRAELRRNCRNTRRIAEYAAGLVGEALELPAGSPDGMPVEVIECADERAMVDAARRAVHRLVSQGGLASADVQLLTTHRVEASAVWKAGRLGNFELVKFPTEVGPGQLSMSTLHSFKGLEAGAVIVCDVRDGDATSSAKHLYVATSRAKHALVVLRYGAASC
jgi:hypothetical protein